MNLIKNPKTILVTFLSLLLFSCDENEDTNEVAICETLNFTSEIIETENLNVVTYEFEATEIIEDDRSAVYSWTVNGRDVATGNFENPQRTINFEFETNGTFEVCVFTETDNCPRGVEKCQSIVIEGIESVNEEEENFACNDLNFTSEIIETENLNVVTYEFEAAEIEESDRSAVYSWTINGISVAKGSLETSQRTINYEFETNGTFEVCVFTETDNCPRGVEKCQSIVIEGIESVNEEEENFACNDLNFTSEIIETENLNVVTYEFEATEIEESDRSAVYSWTINGINVVKGNFETSQRIINYEFETNGTFEVCAFVETNNCPRGVEKCQIITIDGLE